VKVSLVVTHLPGLMVGASSLPGNPFDGHTLAAELEQTTKLLQDLGRTPKQAIEPLATPRPITACSAAGSRVHWVMRCTC
jgi:transposase, IS5 family